jgi:hypothetical protein
MFLRGRWTWLATGVILVAAVSAIALTLDTPEGLDLKQNFPNPFSASTEIRYAIPVGGHVLLHVFNTLGLEVASIVNESELAGNHVTRFDGSSFPSGQYTYILEFTSGDDGSKSKLQKRMYLVR